MQSGVTVVPLRAHCYCLLLRISRSFCGLVLLQLHWLANRLLDARNEHHHHQPLVRGPEGGGRFRPVLAATATAVSLQVEKQRSVRHAHHSSGWGVG